MSEPIQWRPSCGWCGDCFECELAAMRARSNGVRCQRRDAERIRALEQKHGAPITAIRARAVEAALARARAA